MSTFFTYEITSHKRGEGVAKMQIDLITFCSISQTIDKKKVSVLVGNP